MSTQDGTSPKSLFDLPKELIQDIVERLENYDLYAVNLTSRRFNKLAAPLIWRDVELVDCRAHTSYEGYRAESRGTRTAAHSGRGIPPGASVGSADEHDDLPMIKKLLVLAT